MKSAVYKENPHSLHDLKEAIMYLIRNISHTELVHVFTNKIKWVDACPLACGGHFQHLL
jgi:hypothetical protein